MTLKYIVTYHNCLSVHSSVSWNLKLLNFKFICSSLTCILTFYLIQDSAPLSQTHWWRAGDLEGNPSWADDPWRTSSGPEWMPSPQVTQPPQHNWVLWKLPWGQGADDRNGIRSRHILSSLTFFLYAKYNKHFESVITCLFITGGTLADYIQKRCNSLLDEDTILHFFVQILLALYHVHNKLILHRDLKTQNILLDKHQMIVKIGDFGISKILVSKSKAYTVSINIVCTSAMMWVWQHAV